MIILKQIVGLMLLIIVLSLMCSCGNKPLYDVYYPKPVIVDPDEETAYTINGYKDTSVSSQDSSSTSPDLNYEGIYIGNKNSKKLHKTECIYAKNMKDENAEVFDSYDRAKIMGYVECSKCFKE